MDDFEEVEDEPVKLLKEERTFPGDLEGRLNAILNVVNTEFKSATVLHLDDKPANAEEIRARIRGTVGRNCRLPHSANFEAYCHWSLFPIGIVAKEEVIADDGETIEVGHSLTDAGRRYGLPIAAFSLRYAVKNNLSLFNVLGPTNSRGKTRSPLTRVHILKSLSLEESCISKLDEARETRINTVNHIRALQEIAFIEFNFEGETVEATFFPTYKEGKPEPFRYRSSLTQTALNYLNLRGHLNSRDLSSLAHHKLTSDALNVLNSLVRQGFAKRSDPISKTAFKQTTLVRITEAGKNFVDNYVHPIEDALNEGKSLSKLKNEYETLVRTPNLFAEIMQQASDLYREVSPSINRRPAEEVRQEILAYLKSNPGARAKEIETHLGIRGGNHLAALIASGSIRREGRNRLTHYHLA